MSGIAGPDIRACCARRIAAVLSRIKRRLYLKSIPPQWRRQL
ncbi:hypothetical protein [Chromobacterium violaceum]